MSTSADKYALGLSPFHLTPTNLTAIDNLPQPTNYRHICRVVGQPTTAGNQRAAQLKEWARFFKHRTEGYRWYIEEIYAIERMKPETVRGLNRDTAIQGYLLMQLILATRRKVGEDTYHSYMSEKDISEALGYVNELYYENKGLLKKVPETAEEIAVYSKSLFKALPYDASVQLTQMVDTKKRRYLETLLERLSKDRIVNYYKTFDLWYDDKHRLYATEAEEVLIKETEAKVLFSEFAEYKTVKAVMLSKKRTTFYPRVRQILKEKLGIYKYYMVYCFKSGRDLEEIVGHFELVYGISREDKRNINEKMLEALRKKEGKVKLDEESYGGDVSKLEQGLYWMTERWKVLEGLVVDDMWRLV
jgi:hypothetical protein